MTVSMETLSEIIGLVGVALIVLAYFLISAEKISSKSTKYHILNLVGAILILVSLVYHWNLPSFVIEVIWISISMYGLWRCTKS